MATIRCGARSVSSREMDRRIRQAAAGFKALIIHADLLKPIRSAVPDGTIAVIRSQFIKAASVDANGFDLALRYAIETDNPGLFSVFWSSSHIEEYECQEFEDGQKIDGLGSRNFQTIGALNLFNEEPPTVDDGPGDDSRIHDPRGQIIYGRVKMAV